MGRAEERTKYILDRLAREGEVSVAQLASDLGVSPVTVRTFTCAKTIGWTRRSALLGRPPT